MAVIFSELLELIIHSSFSARGLLKTQKRNYYKKKPTTATTIITFLQSNISRLQWVLRKDYLPTMKTSENITARKMSVYWLTLLLLNGINVYPGHGNRGNFLLFRFEDRRRKNSKILWQRKPNGQVTVDFGQIINTKPLLELTRVLFWIAGRDRIHLQVWLINFVFCSIRKRV